MERSDIQGPQRIPIDPNLLRAARTGDKSLLERLLPSIATAEFAIPIPNNGDVLSAQDDPAKANLLLGVTIGGNTALHIAATYGQFLVAEMICKKEISLLVARNVMLETPLHCAARGGHRQVISSIISFTCDDEDSGVGVKTVLRVRNHDGGTALHEAARNGHVKAAEELMLADCGLADMVDEDGISPLYLAAMTGSHPLLCAILGSSSITTTAASSFPVSYAGPNGQTALHAAVFLQNSEIAEELLRRNQMLAKCADNSGSTPLHYAASVGNDVVKLLLQKDTSLAYIPDSSGLFPVHVATIGGELSIMDKLLSHCPDSDELLDNKGRNLLHTAIQHKSLVIVQNICRRSELVKLMNARDYEGNTPLHLAVRRGGEDIVTLLVRNKRINSNIMNKEGLTPLDLSVIRSDLGLTHLMNPSMCIVRCLALSGARASPRRVDHFVRDNFVPSDSEKESKKHISLSRNVAISSVVIGTVAFAAAFTLPGGYRDDGTPILARRYTFKAFVIADTFAFIFSVLSTYRSTSGGSRLVPLSLSSLYAVSSANFLLLASQSLVTAFALAIYLVLAPVSNFIGIVVCVVTFTSLLFLIPGAKKQFRLAIVIQSRAGWTGFFKSHVVPYVYSRFNISEFILGNILANLLIYMVIFLLALQ